jgi:hypothetical protein
MMESTGPDGVVDTRLCTWDPVEECAGCGLQEQLMCRLDYRDTVTFLMNGLPFFVTAIAGSIVAGYGWYLLAWLAYSVFFFFVWEGRVLCSHCPYWAEEGRTLHCHANAGVFKIWRYHPEPMSRSEQAQFIIGALGLIFFPLVLILVGRQWLLAGIGLTSAISWFHGLRRTGCNRCINFSCPANTVPKERVDAYLERNPVMREAWEQSGYRLG